MRCWEYKGQGFRKQTILDVWTKWHGLKCAEMNEHSQKGNPTWKQPKTDNLDGADSCTKWQRLFVFRSLSLDDNNDDDNDNKQLDYANITRWKRLYWNIPYWNTLFRPPAKTNHSLIVINAAKQLDQTYFGEKFNRMWISVWIFNILYRHSCATFFSLAVFFLQVQM